MKFVVLLITLFLCTLGPAKATKGLRRHSSSSCEDIVKISVRSADVMFSGQCKSIGFLFQGGPCPSNVYGGDCVDLATPQEDAFVVISDVQDPSRVYYQGYHQVGNYFFFKAIAEHEGLPEVYNVTLYSNHEAKGMFQTFLVEAPCDGALDLNSLSDTPVQVAFTAQSPPQHRWFVELASLESTWSLESVETSFTKGSSISDQQLTLTKERSVVVPVDIPEGQDATPSVTAHLVSLEGEHCHMNHVFEEMMTAS